MSNPSVSLNSYCIVESIVIENALPTLSIGPMAPFALLGMEKNQSLLDIIFRNETQKAE
jgi:hypothetical protein